MVDEANLITCEQIERRPPIPGAVAFVLPTREGSLMWWILAVAGLGAGAAAGWIWWRRLRYVALGDSIAFGIGSFTLFGYPPRLAKALAPRLRRHIALQNRSRFGLTSTELLGMLEGSDHLRLAIQAAALITVNIGGNDLLQCGYDGACLPGALSTYRANWEGILREIRALNPRATLMALTLYNPYPLADLRRPPVQEGIAALNAIVQDPGLLGRYAVDAVTDLSPLFEGHECAWTWFCSVGDPHPTDTGYAAITQALVDLSEPILKGKSAPRSMAAAICD
jgi:lysophospholipase L1-like esterase